MNDSAIDVLMDVNIHLQKLSVQHQVSDAGVRCDRRGILIDLVSKLSLLLSIGRIGPQGQELFQDRLHTLWHRALVRPL
jgi:hypothetical protein